ncbi:hypothetical protein VNO78_25295 [Psophocarpus tetragonolobus]|uniref:(+)-neomenthol dehydrogenase-like n=1 Tax=Psophocarpus tetragonolobus TaxID=3891 RepID=A0AAN9XEX7_PSOTE
MGEEEAKRYVVVTGANKGIGYGICKKLALNGIVVVLTARNEKRGLDAVESLKEFDLSDLLVFHQLDVTVLQVLLLWYNSSKLDSEDLTSWCSERNSKWTESS